MLYTVQTSDRTYKDQAEGDVKWRIGHLRNDDSLTITPQSPEYEYTVFYGGSERDRSSVGWQGWNQSRTVKATSHRKAIIKALFCNHSPGSRYAAVGPEHGHPNSGGMVLRHFVLVKAEGDEYDYNYSGPYNSGPLRVEEVYI